MPHERHTLRNTRANLARPNKRNDSQPETPEKNHPPQAPPGRSQQLMTVARQYWRKDPMLSQRRTVWLANLNQQRIVMQTSSMRDGSAFERLRQIEIGLPRDDALFGRRTAIEIG